MHDYSKRLVEIDEILSHLSEENLHKIPEEIIKLIKDNKDIEYKWNYNEYKPLCEQNIHRDSIAFLSYLNMEYLMNEKQKQFMKKIHNLNEEKNEEEIRKKYNPDDLFKSKNTDTEPTEGQKNTKEMTALVEYKENFFTRFKNFILKILHINS